LSPDYIGHLISLYRRKGLLVDSNLLLLYFVGAYDPERISTFKGTYSRGFSEDDFNLLFRLIALFEKIVTTPNILTEVSNLSSQLRKDEKRSYYLDFAAQYLYSLSNIPTATRFVRWTISKSLG
jgi:hypothetical protein